MVKVTGTEQEVTCGQERIDAGNDADDSAFIADLARSDDESHDRLANLRDALIEGEKSGEPTRFDVDAFKQKMRAKYG